MRRLLAAWLILTAAIFGAQQSFSQGPSMTLLGAGRMISASGCSQATAFLARNGNANSAEMTTMICGLVTDGVFAKGDVFNMYATDTSGHALLNIIQNAFNGTLTLGTGAFTANRGYTGDGNATFIDTGFNPNTAGGQFTLNSSSMGGCDLTSRTALDGTFMMGALNAGLAGASWIGPRYNFAGGGLWQGMNDSTAGSVVTNANAQGAYTTTRNSSGTAVGVYKAGALLSSEAIVSTLLPNVNFYTIAGNTNGAISNPSGDQIAWIWIGGALSATNVSNLYSRTNTYLTTVGASGCWMFFLLGFYRRPDNDNDEIAVTAAA